MSDGSFPRNQGADPGLPGSDTGEPVGQYDCPPPAGEGGEPLQEPRTLEPQVKLGTLLWQSYTASIFCLNPSNDK